jgi:hypothetical protein
VRTRTKVAGYNLLICAAAGCLGSVVTVFTGLAGGLAYLGVVALGTVIWP